MQNVDLTFENETNIKKQRKYIRECVKTITDCNCVEKNTCLYLRSELVNRVVHPAVSFSVSSDLKKVELVILEYKHSFEG